MSEHKPLDQKIQGYAVRCGQCKFSAFIPAESWYIFDRFNGLGLGACPHCKEQLMSSGLNEAMVSEYSYAYLRPEPIEELKPGELSVRDQSRLDELVKKHKGMNLFTPFGPQEEEEEEDPEEDETGVKEQAEKRYRPRLSADDPRVRFA